VSTRGWAAAFVTLLSVSAVADDRRRVSIAIERCDAGIAEDAARIAAIELHADRTEDAPDVTRIHVVCESPDEIALHVVDPLTSKEVTRKVSVERIDPRARARTIALAVAELVSASWVELETTPEPQVQPIPRRAQPRAPMRHAPSAPTPKTSTAKTPPPTALPPIVFQAEATARVFFESRELLLGGGVVVEPWLARTVLLHFDASVEHANGTRAPGDVSIDAASTSAAFGVGTSAAALRLTSTLGLRAGYARLAGFTTATGLHGQSIAGAWVGPEIGFGLELMPRAHVHPVIHAAFGWAIAGVDAPVPGDRDVLAQGPYGVLAIGFAAN
jgi:hypothetical protein